jgi:DNA-binding response OmpR family regulator
MTTDRHDQVRILLAEEDDATRVFLAENLSADGFTVDAVGDYTAALARLRTTTPDLVLVDVNGKTLGLIDNLRDGDAGLFAVASDTPVVVLTSRVDDVHRVRVLERGGDDIVVKPFSYPELRARVRAVLRRTRPRQPRPVLQAGPLRIDQRRRQVTIDSRPVELSAVEYKLVCKLASEPTRVFTRQELMRDVWGYTTAYTRTLDSHACRLRSKLANDTHRVIVNVWGVGYRLVDGKLQ